VKISKSELLVVGYGSLMSGTGLLGVCRGGRTALRAKDAFPVLLRNVRRGLAKPSSHGKYLAMDIEPLALGSPFRGRIGLWPRSGEIGALGLVFDKGCARAIAWREEYDAQKFVELLDRAEHAGLSLGEFLLDIAERCQHRLEAYRSALYELLGYTSAGYIFHPVVLDEGATGIIAVASGYEGSGSPDVISRRREFGIARLLNLEQAMSVPSCCVDRKGQIGYVVECLLGALHGLDLSDIVALVDGRSELAEQVAFKLMRGAQMELSRFLEATSLSERDYRARFRYGWSRSVSALIELVAYRPYEGRDERW